MILTAKSKLFAFKMLSLLIRQVLVLDDKVLLPKLRHSQLSSIIYPLSSIHYHLSSTSTRYTTPHTPSPSCPRNDQCPSCTAASSSINSFCDNTDRWRVQRNK